MTGSSVKIKSSANKIVLRAIVALSGIFLVTSHVCLYAQDRLESCGLQNEVVISLVAEEPYLPYYPFSILSTKLIAGTQQNGVFIISLEDTSAQWQYMGLNNRFITAMTVQRWGVGPMEALQILTAVQPDFAGGDSTLLYCNNLFFEIDTTWVPADSGIDKRRLLRIWALDSYYYSGHEPPEPSLLGGDKGLYQGNPQNFWHEAQVDSPATVYALDVHPHWHGSLAWAVGFAGSKSAAFKSTDKGYSWSIIFLPDSFQNTGLSVAIHPLHPDSLYVGLDGSVIMTPDGGKSWQSTGLENSLVMFQAIAVDPFAPENIYFGGIGERNSFAFYHSKDEGKSWTPVLPPEGKHLAGVTDIQVMADDIHSLQPCSRVFIATAGTGVWLYRPELTTEIKQPQTVPLRFNLHQNYPNPFNPATTIEYKIARPGRVQLVVYNLRGQRVQVLVDEKQPAGTYRVSWDGRGADGRAQVAGGVYVYELRVGGEAVQRKKMVLLR